MTGIPRLSVENRFIDYYKDTTEIYQGMTLIDTRLGGTTPMDVIIDAPADEVVEKDEYYDESDFTANSYWFNSIGLREAARFHQYLDGLPETGKVLSLHTGMQLLESLNNDRPYSDFKLAVVYKRIPDDVKDALITPYLSADGNQLRFSIRLYESDKSLKRQQLIEKIYHDLITDFDLKPEQVTVSGMAVLYNNLLQSLFRSQILTLGAVFGAILLMFIVLFRALRLSLAAIVPNIIAAGLILGLMGWIGIPLDIMTITIAAINIGIGVDDSIHYIHRFREEFVEDQNYWEAIKRCHNSIARAMYYTSVTVVLGFSILALSNFIPTIYFGILSGLAMITALIANLMLLPILFIRIMNDIRIPISPGELLDKITILQIKAERIDDAAKVANVKTELEMLSKVWNETVKADDEISALTAELKSINEALWEIEDDIRDEERNKRFGDRFIELARAVYVTNDERANAKKKVNLHLNSTIVEEKSYQDYK
jgi:predicted RND superfamily exporter protein